MSKIITLPDHISFEEIALKWCDVFKEFPSTGITFVRFEAKIVNHFVEYDCITDEGHVGQVIIADYYPSDRKILIRDEEKFQPVLDFIKERSNSNHEITIPDHISLERIATIWCHSHGKNAVKYWGDSCLFVQFDGDCYDYYKIAAEFSSNSRALTPNQEFGPSVSTFLDHVKEVINGQN